MTCEDASCCRKFILFVKFKLIITKAEPPSIWLALLTIIFVLGLFAFILGLLAMITAIVCWLIDLL